MFSQYYEILRYKKYDFIFESLSIQNPVRHLDEGFAKT